MKPHPKLKTIAFRAGLACGSVLLTMLLAELACRSLFPTWMPVSADRKFWRYDATLGWFHEPGKEGRFRHPDFEIHVKISSQGLRDNFYKPDPSPQTARVLVLGDSIGWGYGVEQNERFTEIIEAGDPGLEIVNACVSGYGTGQELLYLKKRGVQFQPDIVLLLIHENDFENILHAVEYWHHKPRYVLKDDALVLQNVPVPEPSFKQRVGKFILTRTYLYSRLYRAVWKPMMREMASNERPEGKEPEATSTTDFQIRHAANDGRDGLGSPLYGHPGKRLMRALLMEMNRTARAAGAKLVVVSCPLGGEHEGFLRKALDANGIPYLSLNAAFEAAAEPYHFPHDRHWNPYGHRLAAGAIAPWLQQHTRRQTAD